MPTFTPVIPSGSPGGHGRVIPIGGTSTVIHTATSDANAIDEVSLWAANVTNASANLTLEWGGTTDPSDHLVHEYAIPANSAPICLADRHRLSGGAVVSGLSGTAGAINIIANVDRIQ